MAAAKEYTMEDLKQHTSRSDVWITIEKKVYDVTSFLDEHPGGDEVLLEEAGRDATEAFEDVGHSDEARAELKKLYVGNLKGPLPSATTKGGSSTKSTTASESGGMSLLVPVLILVGAYVAWRLYAA